MERFTVKLREGQTPAFEATAKELESMEANIVGFKDHFDVAAIVAPEKPVTLAKEPAKAAEPK